jgi:hypothetical protein
MPSPQDPGGRARIWYQSFVDPERLGLYIQRLRKSLGSYAAPKRLVEKAKDAWRDFAPDFALKTTTAAAAR